MTKLLVVDDDADIRESLRELLDDEGYDVVCADGGADALQLLAREPLPDLVLLDLIMPGMDGTTVIEQMRSDPRLAPLPVVVLSASSTVRPPAGVPLMRKPIGLDRLLSCIEEQLSGRC
jgi:CheY-like chemotaxis protein